MGELKGVLGLTSHCRVQLDVCPENHIPEKTHFRLAHSKGDAYILEHMWPRRPSHEHKMATPASAWQKRLGQGIEGGQHADKHQLLGLHSPNQHRPKTKKVRGTYRRFL